MGFQHSLLWLDDLPRRPLCLVPWNGQVIVYANGNVEFCCYTTTIIGNVHERPVEELLRGPLMTRVRETLIAQEYPPECRTLSCPLYNNHDYPYMIEQIEGTYSPRLRGTDDPHAAVREALAGTHLDVEVAADSCRMTLRIAYQGPPIVADLFAAFRLPDGHVRFLPDLEAMGVPAELGLPLTADESLNVTVFEGPLPAGGTPQNYEVCAALFVSGTFPTQPAHCYWSTRRRLV